VCVVINNLLVLEENSAGFGGVVVGIKEIFVKVLIKVGEKGGDMLMEGFERNLFYYCLVNIFCEGWFY
jgi:hypothetical protein